jgi:hypothetical protein
MKELYFKEDIMSKTELRIAIGILLGVALAREEYQKRELEAARLRAQRKYIIIEIK